MDKISQIDFLQKYFNILFKAAGLELAQSNWNPGPIYIIELILPIFGTIFYFYNLNLFWDDFEYVCYSTIIAAPLVGGVFRLFYWPAKRKTVAFLYKGHFEFCHRFNKTGKQKKIILKYAIFLNVLNMALLVTFFIVGFLIFCSPIFIYLFLGETMALPLPLYIAGINFKTHPGYELNYIWHCLAIYEVLFVFSLIQMLTLLFVGASTLQIEILRTKVQELEQIILLDLNDNEETIKKHFAEIIDLHNEIIEYADSAESMLSFQYFLDVTTLTVLVVIALFYARVANWIPGYVLAIVVLFAAFMNYGLGELNSIQMQKLNLDIYSVSWYRMSVNMRKMHFFFLQKSIKDTFFTCGGLRPINIDLFASFCNSVYSYLIIVKNMEAKIGIGT